MNETQQSIDGMAVNERLYHFNLFSAFDAAVHARDQQRIVAVLMQVQFTATQATETARVILADPKKYGS